MCGIAGWIDWEADVSRQKPILENMTERLSARGPDASGYWFSDHAGLGHRRLVVVDPAGGKQPMVKHFGDRTYVMVYNGELYNTEDLRRKLKLKGHIFDSYSDTEVLLLSFIEWGPDCLKELNGIFAFGVWNEQEQTLFLARDRMGVKPLFYTRRGSAFLFASELKALLVHPKVKPEVDLEGLAEIFGLGPARTPGSGVFHDVFELRPGYYIVYNRSGMKNCRYWSLQSIPHKDNLEVTGERVRELVEDSIIRQLVSDVPVCTFLSGGLDSSIISAIAAGVYRKCGKEPLRTFSIDYVENDKYFKPNDFQPNDDAPWAERVVNFLETRHQSVFIDIPQLVESLREAVLARDLPGMADVDSSLYLFCKEIKKDATVALSGECADEVFGGYPWFYRQEAVTANTFPWSRSCEIRNRILSKELKNRLNLEEYTNRRYRETLVEVPYLPGEDPAERRQRELFYLNLNWFMAVLLDRKDRMSMASGLEVRVPFCDHRIVEYVWNIPWNMKYFGQREKGILRYAMQDYLPEDVVYRRKSPYPKTHHPGYLMVLKEKMLDLLDNPATPLKNLVDTEVIRDFIMKGESLDKPWFGQLMTGPQLLAYLIQVNIWLEEYKVSIII